MNTKRFKRNPELYIVGGLLGFSLLLGMDSIKSNLQQVSMIRSQVQTNSKTQMALEASQQDAQAKAAIAESRYQSGCVIVVAGNNPDFHTSITEGAPVLDGVRGTALPPNTLVCDDQGNTAKLVPGIYQGSHTAVAWELAFTGNRAVIDAAIAHFKAQNKQPGQI
jgi:hypothetical protein